MTDFRIARRGLLVLMIAGAAITVGHHHHWRPHAQTATLSGQALVIDGDTIVIGEVHVRLFGIDAPETDQTCIDESGDDYRCGLLATALLEEEIAGRPVTCFPTGVDHYGRTIATCEVAGRDLGDWMVRRGFAIAYLRYSTKYADAEIEARRAKRGIWAGNFENPEDWRHRGNR